jgi:inhibitor of KinA sporulation pathway (predicted exonuclease)
MFTEPFVLLDTEFTADADSKARDWKGEHREIIQIAAIGLTPDLTQRWQYDAYVRPRFKPILSSFIQELTGISQREVDGALSLQEVLAPLATLVGNNRIYCYGNDGAVIHDNCTLLGICCPIASQTFVNVKKELTPILKEQYIDNEKFSSGNLIDAFGLTGARAHNALNDMHNLLMVLRELRTRRAL